jgi:hypothetical protein
MVICILAPGSTNADPEPDTQLKIQAALQMVREDLRRKDSTPEDSKGAVIVAAVPPVVMVTAEATLILTARALAAGLITTAFAEEILTAARDYKNTASNAQDDWMRWAVGIIDKLNAKFPSGQAVVPGCLACTLYGVSMDAGSILSYAAGRPTRPAQVAQSSERSDAGLSRESGKCQYQDPVKGIEKCCADFFSRFSRLKHLESLKGGGVAVTKPRGGKKTLCCLEWDSQHDQIEIYTRDASGKVQHRGAKRCDDLVPESLCEPSDGGAGVFRPKDGRVPRTVGCRREFGL